MVSFLGFMLIYSFSNGCYTENQHCDKNRWVKKVKPERGLDQKLIMLPMYHVIFTKLKLLTNNQQVDESGLISPIAR